jgi:hypothetical protein
MPDADFRLHLQRQLRFLARSCASFDAGFSDEAVRVATVIRVLVHQTKASTSLLKLLKATTIDLLSTTEDAAPNVLHKMSMGTISVGSDGVQYFPTLGDGGFATLVPVSKWWDQVVIITDRVRISRRKIVLAAANQDGGAHVDAKLDQEYRALSEVGFAGTGFRTAEGTSSRIALEGTHHICLRQMGYELLNSPSLTHLAGA